VNRHDVLKLLLIAVLLAVVLALLVAVLAAPLVGEAQQATGQRHRVGLLNGAGGGQVEAVFREGLYALGYVEGVNLVIDARGADGRVERLPVLMRELLDAKAEVVVTFGTTAAQAAKAATTTTPIVMAFAGDPVGTRLVASLAKPGGNVTGMSLAASDLSGKRLDLLKEVIPKVIRLTILGDVSRRVEIQETERAARVLGLTVALVELARAEEFNKALGEVSRSRPQALFIINTAVTLTHRARIVDFALKNRVSLVGTQHGWAGAGALMDYASSTTDASRRSAVFVDKILRGAKPADLPVEQPTKFELVINLKTAKALGITIPPSVLGRADHVID
jgi:putative tryptophan/tyrosine transport system substrate-binding protein